jgi:hypothetical protein
VYRIVPDAAVFPQVAALPVEALDAYAELLAALEVAPWDGRRTTQPIRSERCAVGLSAQAMRVRLCI